MKKFSTRLIFWQETYGRKNLPWQINKTPYKVWISEIMLQQTQVQTVIPYYKKFLKEFPSLKKLSETNLDQILRLWSGLGYYTRARNLHKASKIVFSHHGGKIPNSIDELIKLPGIGKSTAGAILSLGFQIKAPILDGNVKRVLSRHRNIRGELITSAKTKELWDISSGLLPDKKVDIYNQAIMDLGATICTKSNPKCESCPVNSDCLALKRGLVHCLPEKVKKKSKETRKVCWLLPQSPSGEVLLEKRETEGIWGGLWSFIETKDKESLSLIISNKFAIKEFKVKKMNKIKHSFSHYNLEVTPFLVKLDHKKKFKNSVWVNNKNVESLGIPAPVKKTINKLTAL